MLIFLEIRKYAYSFIQTKTRALDETDLSITLHMASSVASSRTVFILVVVVVIVVSSRTDPDHDVVGVVVVLGAGRS